MEERVRVRRSSSIYVLINPCCGEVDNLIIDTC